MNRRLDTLRHDRDAAGMAFASAGAVATPGGGAIGGPVYANNCRHWGRRCV